MNEVFLRNRRRIYRETKRSKKSWRVRFRDDNDREMILDIIDDYMDIIDSLGDVNEEEMEY